MAVYNLNKIFLRHLEISTVRRDGRRRVWDQAVWFFLDWTHDTGGIAVWEHHDSSIFAGAHFNVVEGGFRLIIRVIVQICDLGVLTVRIFLVGGAVSHVSTLAREPFEDAHRLHEFLADKGAHDDAKDDFAVAHDNSEYLVDGRRHHLAWVIRVRLPTEEVAHSHWDHEKGLAGGVQEHLSRRLDIKALVVVLHESVANQAAGIPKHG